MAWGNAVKIELTGGTSIGGLCSTASYLVNRAGSCDRDEGPVLAAKGLYTSERTWHYFCYDSARVTCLLALHLAGAPKG